LVSLSSTLAMARSSPSPIIATQLHKHHCLQSPSDLLPPARYLTPSHACPSEKPQREHHHCRLGCCRPHHHRPRWNTTKGG
jgi:hypothetical protein